jgi:hypothetical protein
VTAIQDKFELLRANVEDLREPLAEEESLPDGCTKPEHQFGALYFPPRAGKAFEVHGLILSTCRELGEQDSQSGRHATRVSPERS